MAEELRKSLGVEANLVPGSNGIFDVIIDDKRVFSKFEEGRFPNPGEITGKLEK